MGYNTFHSHLDTVVFPGTNQHRLTRHPLESSNGAIMCAAYNV